MPPRMRGEKTMIEWIQDLSTIQQVAGVVLISTIGLWIVMIMSEGAADDGTERFFNIVLGAVLGLASVGVVMLDQVTTVIGEIPGVAAALFAAGIGYLSIEGLVDMAGPLFVLVVLTAIVVAIGIREA